MAKKEDELITLIDRHELEKQARRNSKLNDRDAQRFVEAIMENYFLDNDNLNFLEDKGIAFFSFAPKEDCFCTSGKKYEDCCQKELVTTIDESYVPYIKSLLTEKDYENYIVRMNNIFLAEWKKYTTNVNCHIPGCDAKAVQNTYYHELNLDEFVSSHIFNPFDARYKMGENFFRDVDKNAFTYYGFCQEHFDLIKAIQLKPKLEEQDYLYLALETIVFRLCFAMVHFNATRYEFLHWYHSVLEMGYKAYMVVHMRKIAGIRKGMLDNFKLIYDNIKNQTFLKLKLWTITLNTSKIMYCRDLVAPQVTPVDFKVVNSVNNVLRTPKFLIQGMHKNGKTTEVFYVYDKLDENMSEFIKQYQKKTLNKKPAQEHFVSNTSLILTDCILFNKAWFLKLSSEEQAMYSAFNKFRFDQPEIGREYIKMQFFAGFDRGNNFF